MRFSDAANEYDLVVAGGGTAGSICAIAAAREGLKVAVIERGSCLGGLACCSGLAEMNAAGFRGKPVYGGIEKEIFDEMIERGAAAYHFGVPMSSNKDVKIDRLRYNPEILKLVLEEKAVLAGVELFYESTLNGASESESGLSLTVEALGGKFTITSSYSVDATGNCHLARMLNYPTFKPDPAMLAVSTLVFRISGVDVPALQQVIDKGGLAPIIEEGYAAGILKGKILAFSPIPGTADVSANVTRAKLDHEDVRSLSAGLVSARRQIDGLLDFIGQKVAGFSGAYISSIAPMMGVRDARRLDGVYRLTLEDLETMRFFEDTVAVGCYPVDIHDPLTDKIIWKLLPGLYSIPFRSLLPGGSKRTLVAGKCICADDKAFAAIRVMPIVMNMGESAGYAIAEACRQNIPVCALKGEELRYLLQSKGVQLMPKSD